MAAWLPSSRFRARGARLLDSDLRFVVQTVATQRSDYDHLVELLRDKPDILDRMLDDPQLFRRLLNDEEALVRVSPWLLFTVLLRRAARDLMGERFTVERLGAGERLPIFDAPRVADLLRDPELIDYLAEMLSSFVRTETATIYYRSGRRYRRRTFSDLDVDDMIALAGSVAPEGRFPFYRRVGDICPVHHGCLPRARRSCAHLRRRRGRAPASGPAAEASAGGVRGRGQTVLPPGGAHPQAGELGLAEVLTKLADNFTLARKPLNYITDHYVRLQRAKLFDWP